MKEHLYGVFVSSEGHIAVDVYSSRRGVFPKWRTYFMLTPSSIARVRNLYRAMKKKFYVSPAWSARRWGAYKEWCKAQFVRKGPVGLGGSLD